MSHDVTHLSKGGAEEITAQNCPPGIITQSCPPSTQDHLHIELCALRTSGGLPPSKRPYNRRILSVGCLPASLDGKPSPKALYDRILKIYVN